VGTCGHVLLCHALNVTAFQRFGSGVAYLVLNPPPPDAAAGALGVS
jgi:hypothetical protein